MMNCMKRDEVMKCLSHNILYLRKSNHISKREMAEILGIGIKTLTKLEQGVLPARLSVEVLFRIKDHFGVSLICQVSEKLGKMPV